jgi:hypothetical protein
METSVNQDLSVGGFAVRGMTIGFVSKDARMIAGSCSDAMFMVDSVTETLSIRLTPHLPMAFQTVWRKLSEPVSLFTPTTEPASKPSLASTLTHISPVDVVFSTSIRSGPRNTSAFLVISSGDTLETFAA